MKKYHRVIIIVLLIVIYTLAIIIPTPGKKETNVKWHFTDTTLGNIYTYAYTKGMDAARGSVLRTHKIDFIHDSTQCSWSLNDDLWAQQRTVDSLRYMQGMRKLNHIE